MLGHSNKQDQGMRTSEQQCCGETPGASAQPEEKVCNQTSKSMGMWPSPGGSESAVSSKRACAFPNHKSGKTQSRDIERDNEISRERQ